jgi:hypothetical protein
VRDRAYLDFVRDRVLADIKEHPSIRPLLGEDEEQQSRGRRATEVCMRGHARGQAMANRRCLECQRIKRREARS